MEAVTLIMYKAGGKITHFEGVNDFNFWSELISGCRMFKRLVEVVSQDWKMLHDFQNRTFMENIIIILTFLSALIYLGNLVYQNFNPKNKAGCSKGCGSCGTIDFDKIALEMESKK